MNDSIPTQCNDWEDLGRPTTQQASSQDLFQKCRLNVIMSASTCVQTQKQ